MMNVFVFPLQLVLGRWVRYEGKVRRKKKRFMIMTISEEKCIVFMILWEQCDTIQVTPLIYQHKKRTPSDTFNEQTK